MDLESLQKRGRTIFETIQADYKIPSELTVCSPIVNELVTGIEKAHCFLSELGREARDWRQYGLDQLDYDDALEDAWLVDDEAHWLLQYYVTDALQNWAYESAADIICDNAKDPRETAYQAAKAFIAAWEILRS